MTQSPPVIAPVAPLIRKGHRPRRKHILPAIGFVLLGAHWIAAAALLLWHYRPTGLQPGDYVVISLAVILCGFYCWIAKQVFQRRHRTWSLAIGAAGIWIFGFPTGTLLSAMLVASLISTRQHFTK